MNWDEAVEEAKRELGITGYADNWNEVVDAAKDIIRESHEREIDEKVDDMKENHKEYLQSKRWKRLRNQALFRDNFKCVDCDRPATEVHHTDYDYMETKREIEFLISLCRKHHQERTDTNEKIRLGHSISSGTKCNYCANKAVSLVCEKPVCRKCWKKMTEGKI